MANYVIEGTISEISQDEEYFKLKGCEGYAIKQNDKKYNLLCSENMTEDVGLAFVLSQDMKFTLNDGNENLLMQVWSVGKRIKLKFDGSKIESPKTTTKALKNTFLDKKQIIKGFVVSALG